MTGSDPIAIAALIVSILALVVAFSTRFSEFANASWWNIFQFIAGLGIWVFAVYLVIDSRTRGQVLDLPSLGFIAFMVWGGWRVVSDAIKSERSNTPK